MFSGYEHTVKLSSIRKRSKIEPLTHPKYILTTWGWISIYEVKTNDKSKLQ
jgi:hypothetical protein